MTTADDIANRVPITIALMLATVMITLDTTIANVALPHMQGSFSASQDQMAWVLTSYIVATAIMTPLSGWLSTRIGRKQVFLVSILGFTIASALCGSSTNLAEIVVFRLMQGLCGAAAMPLSQAVLLDLYPPQQVGQVMAIWGAGIMLGPLSGPVLGGWLTDDFSWRWVFYVNLPVGVLAFLGVWFFMSRDKGEVARPFDFLGYGSLVVFIGALQLALDRGPTLDWFSSREVWIEVICAGIGLYVFIVQTVTAKHPFFDRALALDRNFVTCNLFGVLISFFLFSTMALQPPLMQNLMGYTVLGAGMVMMPRSIGSLASMLIVGRFAGRIDTRFLLIFGLSLTSCALLQMSHFDLSMDAFPFVSSGLLQGFGMSFMFIPMTVLAFATLNPQLRPEATSVYTLTRTLGQSLGISVMEAIFSNRAAVAHGDLAAHVQPSNPVFAGALPSGLNPMTAGGLESLNGEITRQAAMVGYIDVYRLLFFAALMMMPLALVLRPPKHATSLREIVVE